jgi:protein-S-isoprenylcysteine O-methyltransferase Ste14
MRVLFFIYGAISYVLFLVAFLYCAGFVANVVVPKSIDGGLESPLGTALAINLLLLGLFGIQHSVMARPGFKAWWTRLVPQPIERSTYVLFTNLILFLMFWQWRPLTSVVWNVESSTLRGVLWALSGAGWLLALYSSFVIDHFDLFGLRQVFLNLRGVKYTQPQFSVRSVYRWIRHPLLAGFMIAFWATPTMTQGHLLFAVVTAAYTLVGIQLEERDLAGVIGPAYVEYRQRTPMLLPLKKR